MRSIIRVLFSVWLALVMVAPSAMAANSINNKTSIAQAENLISPTQALQTALATRPGSKGLGVRLLSSTQKVYIVKLKSGSTVQKVLVDARTGAIVDHMQ